MNTARLLRFALVVTAAAASLTASDWPSWRGPNRNGISPETDWSHDWPKDGPTRLWKAQVGVGFSSMVIAGGRVFTLGHRDGKDTVHALAADTGESVWTHSYAEPLADKMYEGGPNATPLAAGDTVFTTSKSGHLFALEAATGKVRWETNLKQKIGAKLSDWGVSGSPYLHNGRLIVPYGPSGVALDPATGAIVWSSGKRADSTYAAPVAATLHGRDTLLFIMSEALIGVAPATGEVLWTSAFGKGYKTHCSDPVVNGDRVFISSGDDGGEVLNFASGKPVRVWKNMELATFTGSAVLIDGLLYGHNSAGYKGPNQELRCVRFDTGEVVWGMKGYGQGSLIAAGDRLIALSDAGELSVVRASSARAELLARAQVIGGKTWTAPALANGRLYVRNAKGELICLDLRPRLSARL
jgi:outer membrane protein assembly factor BamB